MCFDAPDTSGVNAAAKQSAELGQQSFDWFKSEYEKTQGQRDKTQALADEVAQTQLSGMQFATEQAKQAAQRDAQVFRPLQDQLVADAKAYDTEDRRSQAAAEAQAGVVSATQAAEQAGRRNLLRMGVDPGSGRSLALTQDAALMQGANVAGASRAAVKDVEQQGYARKMDAAGLGMGVVSNQATQQQIASGTGGAAVGASGAALSAGMSGAQLMGQGFNTALQGAGQAGQLYGTIGGLQSQTRGQDTQLLGQAFGALGNSIKMPVSDETKKIGTGTPGDKGEALQQVNAVQVDDGWRYDPAKVGVDDGGVKHTGPMAQRVRAVMGERAAPGGKAIDLVTMNGKTMLAVQALTDEVKAVKRRLVRMEKSS